MIAANRGGGGEHNFLERRGIFNFLRLRFLEKV